MYTIIHDVDVGLALLITGRQNCRHGYMYPLVSASRTLLRTCIRLYCIRRHVDGYKLLVRDTYIRLHVSDVNAA